MPTRKLTSKDKDSAESSQFVRFIQSEVTQFIVGLIVLMFTVYAAIAIFSFFFTGGKDQSIIENIQISFFKIGRGVEINNWTGARGAYLSNILINKWFGIPSLFMLFFFVITSFRLMRVKYFPLLKYFTFCTVWMIWWSIALTFFLGYFFEGSFLVIGGEHGKTLSKLLINNVGLPGTFFIILMSLVIIMIFVSKKTIPFLRRLFKYAFNKKFKKEEEPLLIVNNQDVTDTNLVRPKDQNKKNDKEGAFEIVIPDAEEPFLYVHPDENQEHTIYGTDEDESNELLSELGVYDPTLDLSTYRLPGIDLLKKYDTGDKEIDMEEQNANKNRIITTLEHYGIGIKSIKATVGPTITLYEIIPDDGVRISKIRNLEDDIAMSLAAYGIRIIAPMPGKGTIGIEVPNKEPQIVSMQSIIASRKYQESNFELPIALGKTITNEVYMVDLCKMPHLLIAGATGQGKSVGLNAAITSLLYKKHPAELKFVLVDPKMVEFNIYSAIEKHFLAKLPEAEEPIITDFTKVIYTLKSLTQIMDNRYDLLKKAGARNIKEYNEKFIHRRLNPYKGHDYMPYIVVIIDEFGDLIMTAGKEIELPLARIAQKARAVGIHMIIATQRPTTNIITGTIKANFPARVAFKVSSMIDSRTILDAPGANQLIGRGDMLFSQGSDMTRVQCAFVDTPEVENISRFIGNQPSYPTAFYLPEYVGDEAEKSQGNIDLSDRDPLFEEVARFFVTLQQASTSHIQRKYSIGYNRAGRLMDQLETAKIVGPPEGSKPRQVLVQDEYQLEQVLGRIRG